MPTPSTFTIKFARADQHLKALNNEVAAFLQMRPYEIVTKNDISAGSLCAQVIYQHAPSDLLLMLIGDVLQNLRSALDHLAWSLAGTHANKRTEFPIFLDKRKFNAINRHGIPERGSGLEKMHGMPVPAQTAIESLQPYQRVHGLPEESEPLWLLHQLSIEDKHRALNLVAAGVDARLDVSTSPIHPAYGLTGRTGYLPLEDGKEIYRIPLPADPSQVRRYSNFTFDVALDTKGPGRGVSLREGLRDMQEAVGEAIGLLQPFVP
jgi:hypothetical protein